MRRFLQPWALFGTCVLILLGAMGWLSVLLLRLDQASASARQRAILEENCRLALWRMDSMTASLMAAENARPAYEYDSFFPIDSTYTRMLTEIRKGDVLVPSPLLTLRIPGIRLHFQFDAAGRLTSPQVPEGNLRDLAETSWTTAEAINQRSADLQLVAGMITRDDLLTAMKGQPPATRIAESEELLDRLEKQEEAPQQVAALGNTADYRQSLLNTQEFEARQKYVSKSAPAAQRPAAPRDEFPPEEKDKSDSFFGFSRAKKASVAAAPSRRVNEQTGHTGITAENDVQEEAAPLVADAGSPEWKTRSSFDRTAADSDLPEIDSLTASPEGASAGTLDEKGPADRETESSTVTARPDAGRKTEEAMQIRRFEPVWIGSRLFAVRQISGNGNDRLQGIWIDWPVLQDMLLDTVRDLLPNAELIPVGIGASAPDMRRLAALPVRLLPGPLAPVPGNGLSAVQVSLLVAWLGVLAAVFAAATLLRGVLALSERRAAFVSAVTHELRTPLTTFQMYTEMLAEGMVPQPERQKEYYTTLRTESERLGHLVENVLLFARLEKSRVDYKLESIELAELLDRVEPRLQERAKQAEMELVIGRDSGSARVMGDMAAVERILFNLVDNACKYAAEAADRRILIDTVVLGQESWAAKTGPGGSVFGYLTGRRKRAGVGLIRVRDFGPGISCAVRKRLFSAFNKSGKDTAETAPGVGLGLALSRRLARKMEGDLLIDESVRDGAGFLLILKIG